MIRLFDIVFSALGLLILSPLLVVIYVLVRLESRGGGIYVQERIGKDGVPFQLYKFRTMRKGSDRGSLITIGEHDERITRMGYFLRRYKLDELPQLVNVLKGDMSMVGPRPEVARYVALYTDEQREVLSVKPGITDYASIKFIDENEILGSAADPDKAYIERIMPEKIRYNMKYIHNRSVLEYFRIIFLTLGSIVRLPNKLVDWYFNKKSLPFWIILLIDVAIVFLSFLFVSWLFIGGEALLSVIEYVVGGTLLYMIFYTLGFRLFKTYSGILRYSSFVDLQRIGYAMFVGAAVSYAVRLLGAGNVYLSAILGRDIIISSVLATMLLWGERVLVKTLYDVSLASINAKYAFIYGVKNGGIGIAKRIRSEKPMRFSLQGFVSDDKADDNRILMGVKVHRLDDELVRKMVDGGVEALIISPYRIEAFRNNEQLQNELIEAGIRIYITQQEKEWDDNDIEKSTRLKEISIEDLLPRNEIQIDMESVGRQLHDSTILITGSAGSIGSEMVRQIAALGPRQLVLIDQAETPQHDIRLMMQKQFPDVKAATIVTSITNERRMEAIFRKYRPDYVFHAAAYKHVPMMEDNPSESVYNNIHGTKIVADMAVKYFTKKFVMISTDKAVNPTNVMGCSKRICEIYVQSLDKAVKDGRKLGITQFTTTRFGNVLGSNGSVIPLFKEQIRQGGPVTVTHPDIIRYFMLISEACKLVLEAGAKGKGGEIFVFDMGKPVKIADLARRMIKLSNAHDVEIKFTGLRQGEKLYEELLNVEETTKPSFHPKIRIATVREYDYNDVCCKIDALLATSLHFDDMQTVRKMKEIVPEYKSNNSVYDVLDKPADSHDE